MNSQIKPRKLCRIDFSYASALKTQSIKRVRHLTTLDLQHIHAEKNRGDIRKIIKSTKQINAIVLSLNFASKVSTILSILSRKIGPKNISLVMPHGSKPTLDIIDPQAHEWYPLTNNTQSLLLNNANALHANPFLPYTFPKSITHLTIFLNDVANEMIRDLGQATKLLKNLKSLKLNHVKPYTNLPKVNADFLENMLRRKDKLHHISFNGHITGTSLTAFRDVLKQSPLKSLVLYENICKAWDYKIENFQSFFKDHEALEHFNLIVIGQSAEKLRGCSEIIRLISDNKNLKSFKLDIDSQVALDFDDAKDIKNELSKLQQIRAIELCFNQNYSNKTTKEEGDTINFEISRLKQLEEVKVFLKNSTDPRVNLQVFKTISNNIFHFTKLKELEIKTKSEVHESALLYLLWCIKNLHSLESLKVKTVLLAEEMASIDVAKVPTFENPRSLKNISLEWESNFEYIDKIFSFIGLQRELEHLHIGIVKSGVSASKDCSKALAELRELKNLKSFHILSTSFSLFKMPCFDAYTRIVMESPQLESVGLTFLESYTHLQMGREILQTNSRVIDLNKNVCGFLSELGKKKTVVKLYLNMKLKFESGQEFSSVFGNLAGMERLSFLSICPELLYKKNFEAADDLLLECFEKEVMRLDRLKNLCIGVDHNAACTPKMRLVIQSISNKMSGLGSFTSFTGLPRVMTERIKTENPQV